MTIETILPMVLSTVLLLTVATNIVTQVIKGVLPQVPSNLLALAVSFVVSGFAFAAYISYTGTEITLWIVTGFIAMCFCVAFAAMYGYDKFVEMINQFKNGGGSKYE